MVIFLLFPDPDAGKDWRQEEKETTEDEMVGWHHQIHGHKFEQALRNVDGQGSLACCSLWGHKESDTTEQLNWTELNLLPLDESEPGEWKSSLKAQHSENEDHGIRSHHFMENRWGNSGNSVRFYFGGAPRSLQMVTAAMKLKDTYSLEEKLWPT